MTRERTENLDVPIQSSTGVLTAAPPGELQQVARREGGFFRRISPIFESKVAILGLAIVIFWILVAIFAPLLAPYDPLALVDAPISPPSAEHPLGTDQIGRDVLSRLIYGSRLILILAPISVLTATALGTTLGMIAGYFGGFVDEILMRILDAQIAFPTMLLYLIIIAAIGPSPVNVVLAIALGSTPGIARIVRSLVLDIRTREFVAAARLRGEASWYIMLVEILPNARGPLIVDAALRVGYATFAIGTLGFLGLGPPPPTPDWGSMVAEGRNWILMAPWIVLFPSIAISSLVVGLNLFADGIREISLKA